MTTKDSIKIHKARMIILRLNSYQSKSNFAFKHWLRQAEQTLESAENKLIDEGK